MIGADHMAMFPKLTKEEAALIFWNQDQEATRQYISSLIKMVVKLRLQGYSCETVLLCADWVKVSVKK